jgi:ferrous iron transport protein A
MRGSGYALDAEGRSALGRRPVGYRGRIAAVDTAACVGGIAPAELERRLVEMGFIEGARVEILHQGLFGADPIAVRIDGATVALRRSEAHAILTEPLGE